jgi:hypothetical protein
MLSAFYPEKVKKSKSKIPKKTRMLAAPEVSDSDGEDDGWDAPCEDCPFEAVAGLDDDMDVGLSANAEVPMEFEGEPLTAAELASVDMAEKEFTKKVHTLAAEADTTFEEAFYIKCTDAERKSTSWIMDVVSYLYVYFIFLLILLVQPSKLASKVNHSTQLLEAFKHIIIGLKEQVESTA